MFRQVKSELNHMARFLTDSAGLRELLKISIGKHAFNPPPCLGEPESINLVLSGSLLDHEGSYSTVQMLGGLSWEVRQP